MVQRVIEFALGLLFGLGLLVSGMTDPGKVLGFLDVLGAWDPSLALVMGGAVGVGLLGYAWARRLTKSWCGQTLHWPQAREIDRPLVLGSLMFGVRLGAGGLLPGPGLGGCGGRAAFGFDFCCRHAGRHGHP